MNKRVSFFVIFFGVLFLIYISGPKVKTPHLTTELPEVNSDFQSIENDIQVKESFLDIRPGNNSQLIWANNSLKHKTKYSLVYLHGFSASPEEGNPAHVRFAKRYGMNLYVPLLFEHGLESEETMLGFTAEGFIDSAKEAIAIGQQLGDSVIVMACSTGGTAALYAASGNQDIHSLILYSPNIDLYDASSTFITMPWGLQIFQLIMGGNNYSWQAHEEAKQYWYTNYRIESIVQMKALLQATMKEEVFEKINQPVFLGYYYKNEEEQDNTVSVLKMHEMFEQLETSVENKRSVGFPNAATHGIQNKYFSKDYEGVINSTFQFAEEILRLIPVNRQ